VRILVVNAGSSSLKLSLIGDRDETLDEQQLDAPRATVETAELRTALEQGLGDADAVGHRIVHGGERFSAPVRINDSIEASLRELVALAPLHQPKSLAALDAVSSLLPQLPAVACFDTAFHAALPPAAATYALPASWRERWQIRRYGFHGLSHAWVARRASPLIGENPGPLRLVSAHLGAGASLCAILDGKSIDTTMGFTPLEGLVMATRSGTVDPGLMLWLLEEHKLTHDELADALEHESGLKGLAGEPDMRVIETRVRGGDPVAELALDVYVHRLRAGIGAMAAALGGIDALAFTGGVGEHSAEVRARTVDGLGFLGLAIDEAANRALATERVGGDSDISGPGSDGRTLVIEAREDLEIAQQTRVALAAPAERGQ
jgi:acetate kinase